MNDTELTLELEKPACFLGVTREETVQLCAWCEGSERLTALLHGVGILASHGICPTCADQFIKGAKRIK